MTPDAPLNVRTEWVPVESFYDEVELESFEDKGRDVEVVLASDYRALAEQNRDLEKWHKEDGEALGLANNMIDDLKRQLADAQARVDQVDRRERPAWELVHASREQRIKELEQQHATLRERLNDLYNATEHVWSKAMITITDHHDKAACEALRNSLDAAKQALATGAEGV